MHSLTNLWFHLLHVTQPHLPLFTGARLMGLSTASPVGECEAVRCVDEAVRCVGCEVCG